MSFVCLVPVRLLPSSTAVLYHMNGCDKLRDTGNTLVIEGNECLWGVDTEFKILMRKVKSPLKQTTPLQICSAPFLNSPE